VVCSELGVRDGVVGSVDIDIDIDIDEDTDEDSMEGAPKPGGGEDGDVGDSTGSLANRLPLTPRGSGGTPRPVRAVSPLGSAETPTRDENCKESNSDVSELTASEATVLRGSVLSVLPDTKNDLLRKLPGPAPAPLHPMLSPESAKAPPRPP
jgi:hypothetical protein